MNFRLSIFNDDHSILKRMLSNIIFMYTRSDSTSNWQESLLSIIKERIVPHIPQLNLICKTNAQSNISNGSDSNLSHVNFETYNERISNVTRNVALVSQSWFNDFADWITGDSKFPCFQKPGPVVSSLTDYEVIEIHVFDALSKIFGCANDSIFRPMIIHPTKNVGEVIIAPLKFDIIYGDEVLRRTASPDWTLEDLKILFCKKMLIDARKFKIRNINNQSSAKNFNNMTTQEYYNQYGSSIEIVYNIPLNERRGSEGKVLPSTYISVSSHSPGKGTNTEPTTLHHFMQLKQNLVSCNARVLNQPIKPHLHSKKMSLSISNPTHEKPSLFHCFIHSLSHLTQVVQFVEDFQKADYEKNQINELFIEIVNNSIQEKMDQEHFLLINSFYNIVISMHLNLKSGIAAKQQLLIHTVLSHLNQAFSTQFFTDIFCGTFKVTKKCNNCKACSEAEVEFSSISLPIAKKYFKVPSINDCIYLHDNKEESSNELCSICNKKTSHIIKKVVENVPPILILMFDRINMKESGINKDRSKVQCQVEVEIFKRKAKLRTIICQSGTTIAKHFKCCVYNERKDEWIYMNGVQMKMHVIKESDLFSVDSTIQCVLYEIL
ncbi:hypothetical protein TRFO_43056 [Tritrichomonas foetus]|uniref:USP domain-containing protein n=1 Tax=Tritrichomonas foetus TaxID=1144522 RepID=A0A1J4KT29_9EUKA|nr:hypothetical protein TRFO_43056 [Tritrichomonas foetus]|eukprot:OHT14449.1 hypothetical protein TRFO_43056 [Tritrichomonas foetus]